MGGDSHLPDINLARLLVGCVGLRHIHLVLESSTIKLRHTLQHEMQPRLNKVTLEGSKIVRLHPAAFKVTADRSSSNNFQHVSLKRLLGGFLRTFGVLTSLYESFERPDRETQ